MAQSMFCDRETGLPTALRFTSLADYELRKAICAAVASIRDASGVTPLEVRRALRHGSCEVLAQGAHCVSLATQVLEFCVDVLQSHDNTGNAFDDAPLVTGAALYVFVLACAHQRLLAGSLAPRPLYALPHLTVHQSSCTAWGRPCMTLT